VRQAHADQALFLLASGVHAYGEAVTPQLGNTAVAMAAAAGKLVDSEVSNKAAVPTQASTPRLSRIPRLTS
jgi:hypothetical protein